MRPLASVILCVVLAGGGCQAPPPPIDPAPIEDRALLGLAGPAGELHAAGRAGGAAVSGDLGLPFRPGDRPAR